MEWKTRSHYRPASSASAIKEDQLYANNDDALFAVIDGVSGPYSPSNPRTMYGKYTGAQMVGNTINYVLQSAGANDNIESLLKLANDMVSVQHFRMDKYPQKDAVGGACVAACQLYKSSIAKLVLIGDCVAIWRDDKGIKSLMNFDQAAYDYEQKGDEAFRECLAIVDAKFPETRGKNIGKAWDKYFPYFSHKQFFRANRNTGQGGHAMLNGDPYLPTYWTTREIPIQSLKWILLVTDGLVPPSLMDPRSHLVLEEKIGNAFEKDYLYGLREWRDKIVAEHEASAKGNDTPHIEGNPEGSAIAISFS